MMLRHCINKLIIIIIIITRCLGGPKVFSRATRGAVQALRVAAAALFKLQWSLMVLGGPKVFSSAT